MAKTNKSYFESRWVMTLHAGMMLGVIVQLVSSQLMHSNLSNAVDFFYLHRLAGVWTFVMVVLFIGVKGYRRTLWDLFPWHRRGVCAIKQDVGCLLTARLPVRQGVGLARFIQGLGILLVLAMGALGIAWWIMRAWQVGAPSDARLFIHWHANLATLLWIYIVGHVAMVVLHAVWPKARVVEMP